MAVRVALDPADQKRRRRRARISQGDIARRLDIGLSTLSEYENSKGDLPWGLTPDDYEAALAAALLDKRQVGGAA